MKKKKIRLALVGKDVSKSASERIHTFILGEWGIGCEYERISVSASEFDEAMRRMLGDFDGFNVTIPYKRDVFEYLETVNGDAFDCGAVNTVLSARRAGYNTDGVGFLMMLETAGIVVKDKKILVLGAGGAGRSTAAALKKAGATVYMYRRNREELEEVCAQLGVNRADDPEQGGFDILINSTGVGMHDSVGRSPVSLKAFSGGETAVDLIYVPEQSEFLRQAASLGLRTLNGAAMLFYQAYYSDCLYLERKPNADEAKELYEKYLAQIGGENK